jgi:hypothetical protein
MDHLKRSDDKLDEFDKVGIGNIGERKNCGEIL